MNLLKRLKIGRRCYRIRYRDMPELYSQIGLDDGLLDLAEDLEGEDAAYAALHEVLHGIWEQRKLPVRSRDERVVTDLAWGMARVFRDNPGLLVFLDKLLKQAR